MSENKNSRARLAASKRYRDKTYEDIHIVVLKGQKEKLKQIAIEQGYGSINKYVNTAIEEKMTRDKVIEKGD